MVYTVTLNPSLDRTIVVPELRPGAIHRATSVRQDVGGKGINVSRALAALGIPSTPIGFLGGGTGQTMRRGLADLGFTARFVETSGETRQNLTLLDAAAGVYTKINEPGAPAGPEQVQQMRALCAGLAAPGDLWAFCGSLPPGAPPDLYADLIARVQARGSRAILDTSGEALRLGLAARPFGVKPNYEEACEALGLAEGAEEAVTIAMRLQDAGVSLVCLTQGARGLVLATGDARIVATPPRIHARSPVGAGDATLAGLLWALLDNCAPAEMARRAVACGAAAAAQDGTGVEDRALVESFIPRVHIE